MGMHFKTRNLPRRPKPNSIEISLHWQYQSNRNIWLGTRPHRCSRRETTKTPVQGPAEGDRCIPWGKIRYTGNHS